MVNLLALRIQLSCFLSSAVIFNRCDGTSTNLENLQGNITYERAVRHDKPSWNLPLVDGDKYALFIYVANISMTYSEGDIKDECSGDLCLPEMGSICKLPIHRCLLYTSVNISCGVSKLSKYITNWFAECSTILWYSLRILPRTIKMKAHYPDRKSFHILYDNIQCNKNEEEKNTSTPVSLSSTISWRQSNTRSSSPVGYIIAIVILIILLAIAMTLLFLRRLQRHRRKKHVHSEEHSMADNAENNQPLTTTSTATSLERELTVNHYEYILPSDNQNERHNVQNQLYNA